MKRENGSVTLFVLVSCMFFVSILLLTNIGLINKTSNQRKQLDKIIENYEVNDSKIEQEYQLALNRRKCKLHK